MLYFRTQNVGLFASDVPTAIVQLFDLSEMVLDEKAMWGYV